MDKNFSYSFVLQHPNNRIVIPFTEKKLYLVACYKINNETTSIDVIDINSIKHLFNNIKLYYPKQYTFETFTELVEKKYHEGLKNYNSVIKLFETIDFVLVGQDISKAAF